KLDTLETLLVFLAWSVHNGSLAREDFAAHMKRVRALVSVQDFPAWGEVATNLRQWPTWLGTEEA
ncbi:MAG TPA: hypothetical protein VF316_25255, partial [Polyangiaceae bacterium]